MTDLAPLPRCPNGKKGRHNAMLYVAEGHEDEGEKIAVWSCGPCGAMRIVPLDGSTVGITEPLDSLDADEIRRRVQG